MAAALSGHQERRAEEQQAPALNVPIGYKFCPRDDELIVDYLVNKIMGFQLPSNVIRDVDFYEYDPRDLPTGDFKHGRHRNEAYYFIQTQQSYSKTEGTERSSQGGYWKACDEDEEEKIYFDGEIVGFKTTFLFYWRQEIEGIGKKSSWVMDEFRVNPSNTILPTEALADDTIKAKMQRWVICRIVNKEDDSTEEDYSQQSCYYEIKTEEEDHSEEGLVDELKIDNLNN